LKPSKVLFVCTGNTCRSVMAELILKKKSEELNWPVEVRSAGIAADPRNRIPYVLTEILDSSSMEWRDHQPLPVGAELMKWADIVLVMSAPQKEFIEKLFPGESNKVRLIKELAGSAGDVRDPIGQEKEVYEAVFEELRILIDRIVEKWGADDV